MKNAWLVELEDLAVAAAATVSPWAFIAGIATWIAVQLPSLATKAGDWYETGNVELPPNEKLQAAIEQISHALCRVSTNIAVTAGDERTVTELVYPPGVESILGNPLTWVANESKMESIARAWIKVMTNREVYGPIYDNWSTLPNWLDTLQVEGIVARFDEFLQRFNLALFYTDPVDQIERGIAEWVKRSGSGSGSLDLAGLQEVLDRYFLIVRGNDVWSISDLLISLINTGWIIYK